MEDRQPRWAVEFLRQLVLTGNARRAAQRAGVDIATLFGWRERSREFTGLWEAALSLREEFLEHIETGREPSTPPASAGASSLHAATP